MFPYFISKMCTFSHFAAFCEEVGFVCTLHHASMISLTPSALISFLLSFWALQYYFALCHHTNMACGAQRVSFMSARRIKQQMKLCRRERKRNGNEIKGQLGECRWGPNKHFPKVTEKRRNKANMATNASNQPCIIIWINVKQRI